MSDAATATGLRDPELEMERYRVELTGYCYRMLGSAFDAEDAVQDTLVRAWKAYDRFEGRSALRSWLYRIATNVCLDMLAGTQRRARPMDLGPESHEGATLGPGLPEVTWLGPVPDGRVLSGAGDPAELAVARDSVRLAFVAALQHLPARQRAVLILREVLCWKASEVAELLETTVASVNSALQRARATLSAGELTTAGAGPSASDEGGTDEDNGLLDRYVAAFESYDIESLVRLLHEDATLSMPPYDLWLRGAHDIRWWMLGPGSGCQGSRLVPIEANGCRGFGQYRASTAPEGGHDAWALQVIEIVGGRIVGLNSFLDTAQLFPLFGLPLRLEPLPANALDVLPH